MTRTVDTLELWSPDRLIPYEKNSRVHTDEQVKGIAESIAAFGFLAPIVVDTQRDRIAAGHGRLLAARVLGMERVPVVLVDHLTADEFRAYVIADNQHGDRSTFDRDILADELRHLDAGGFDLAPIGFEDDELAALLSGVIEDENPDEQDDDDEHAEPPEVPVSALGDVWAMGDHRAACGDSMDREAVAALYGADVADIILTDPPYCSGGFQEGGRTVGSTEAVSGRKIQRDNLTTEGLRALIEACIARLPCSGCCYVFCDWRQIFAIRQAVEPLGFQYRALLIWAKESAGMGGPWRHQYELAYFGTRRKEPAIGKSGDVLRCKRSGNVHHTTEKPVDLLVQILENTNGTIVADPFGGSGSTLIACEKTGRAARVMELTPAYVDVIVDRWQALTGGEARLLQTGETFAEVRARRLGA